MSAETIQVLEDEIGDDSRQFHDGYGRTNLWSMVTTSSD